MSAAEQQAQAPVWDDVREQLRGLLGEEAFSRWFQTVTASIEETNGVYRLQIASPDKFQRDWLREHYGSTIEALWRNLEPSGTVIFTMQERQAAEPERLTAKVIQLDFWDESKRGAPNAIFRSALFPALNNKQKREFLKEQKIFSVRGIEITFTGERFSQSDLDVYLEILNFARPFPLGAPVIFSAHAMLKALGRSTGNHDHQWLHSVLIRLRSGTIDMADHEKRFFGGLIEGGFKDEVTKHYEITLNPKFAALFGLGMWATIDRDQRRDLGRNETAKALHGYYATHTAPDAHAFDTLADLADLKDSNKPRRNADIVKAHKALENVGFLSGYEHTSDTIKAHINHSPGQLTHLALRRRKPKKPVKK